MKKILFTEEIILTLLRSTFIFSLFYNLFFIIPLLIGIMSHAVVLIYYNIKNNHNLLHFFGYYLLLFIFKWFKL